MARPQATDTQTNGGSRQTQTAQAGKRQRRGSEGRSAKSRGRGRPDDQGRPEQASNKAGSGQGSRKN